MKSLNGNTFECQLFCRLEFTQQDADQFLAAPFERRRDVLNEICSRKQVMPEPGNYNADEFRKAIGRAMADRREAELKQLTQGEAA